MTLTTQLTTLENSGLIYVAQTQPDLEYLFRHTLVQEAAYSSLLKNHRRALHRLVAEALEQNFPDQLDELSPLLGFHFAEADEPERALRYYTRAGDVAARIYANAEAAMHYAQALRWAQALSRVQALSDLHIALGRVLELNARYDEALRNYAEMEADARQRGDSSMALTALMQQCNLRCTTTPLFDPVLGETLARTALAMAESLGDRAAESKILWNLLNLYRFTDHVAEALECGERSLALARELNLREQLAYTLNDLAHVYAILGALNRTKAMLREAHDLWRALGNLPMLADSLSTSSMYHTVSGDYDAALAFSSEALEVSQATHNLWGQSYSMHFAGNIHWDRGDAARAMQVMEQTIRLAEQSGFLFPQFTTRGDLALLCVALGDTARGIALSGLAVSLVSERAPAFLPWALAAQARVLCLTGDVAAAAAIMDGIDRVLAHPLIRVLAATADTQIALAQRAYVRADHLAYDAMAWMRQNGIRTLVLDLLFMRAQALMGLEEREAARACLTEARTEAEALGSRRMAWRILAALSDIEAQDGNANEAATLRAEAREIVAYIADHCPPDLRASFLQLPAVVQVNGGRGNG